MNKYTIIYKLEMYGYKDTMCLAHVTGDSALTAISNSDINFDSVVFVFDGHIDNLINLK